MNAAGRPSTFTYTPTTGFTGTDSFTYQICDTDNACDTATVTINVNTVSAPQTLAAAADSRVLQASPTVNAGNLRCEFNDKGECINVKPCFGDLRTELGDDCMRPAEERAWSSPIFVRPM